MLSLANKDKKRDYDRDSYDINRAAKYLAEKIKKDIPREKQIKPKADKSTI